MEMDTNIWSLHDTQYNLGSARHRIPQTLEAECVSVREDEKGVAWVTLENESGLKVELNGSLFIDNGLPIPKPGLAEVTAGVYDLWFEKGHVETRAALSRIMHHHFDGIVASKQAILDDLELYMVRIDQTGPRWAVGALLEAWDNDSAFHAPDGEGRITQLSRPGSGRAIRFTAWHANRGFYDGILPPSADGRLARYNTLRGGSSFIRGMQRLADMAAKASKAPPLKDIHMIASM